MKKEKVEGLIRSLYERKLPRKEKEVGCSELFFCLNKILLDMRHPIDRGMNGKMLVGQLFHKHLLPEIVKGGLHKPRFEVELRKEIDGFILRGHADAIKGNTVYELKTTWSHHSFEESDPLTQRYIDQGNMYAFLADVKRYCIIVVDLSTDRMEDFVSVIEGERDPERYERGIERVKMLAQAYEKGVALVGPEFDWECRYCVHYRECEHHQGKLEALLGKLPATRSTLKKAGLEKELELAIAHGLVYYNKKSRRYCREEVADGED